MNVDLSGDDDWLEWNLGRSRAERAAQGLPIDRTTPCETTDEP